jgi:hypothetical protein
MGRRILIIKGGKTSSVGKVDGGFNQVAKIGIPMLVSDT